MNKVLYAAIILPLLFITVYFFAVELRKTDNPQSGPRGIPISIGEKVVGRLELDDYTDVFADGSFTDLYRIYLAQGQEVVIEMHSDEFDTYLSLLRGPGDQLVDNDNISSENKNSRLTYDSTYPGWLYIAATSIQSKGLGTYSLKVNQSTTNSKGTVPVLR